MRTTATRGLLLVFATVCTTGCSKEEATTQAPPAETAAPAKTTPPPPAPAPTPSTPPVECPEGSSGKGTFDEPCQASGAARMMEVEWTGKLDDQGPSFRVTNTSKEVILYGKMAVYFYDKTGKQLEVKSASDPNAEPRPFHVCSGNMFAGVMKAGEKAVLTFSCVKAKHVPEEAKAIEAEMQVVGFADDSEKQTDYYWENKDLVTDVRPKGGIKPDKKKGKKKK